MDEIKVYVVGYWSHVALVTTDEAEAQALCEAKRAEYDALPWEVRSIEEAVRHAYETGVETLRD